MAKPKKMKKPKKPTRGKLVKKLDAIFSQRIRLIHTNPQGYAQCFTCGDTLHWKNLQCGHFVSRGNYKYRWDEQNAKCQCYRCNCIFSGNYKIYTSRMIDIYGKEKIDEMIHDKEIEKIGTPRIVERIDYFKQLVEHHKKRLGI